MDKDFMVEGFSNGFSLGVQENCPLSKTEVRLRPANTALLAKLKEEQKHNRIIGPFAIPPLHDMIISPLYVIPKPCGTKHRLIFNLSSPQGNSVNDFIKEENKSVHYCSVEDVAKSMVARQPVGNVWLAKVDLADAYRIVPIRTQDWKFLGICVQGEFYIDRMLPMGASSSCNIFQRISDGIKSMFHNVYREDADVFNYLDDFLFMASSREACDAALIAFEDFCLRVGIPMAAHKTVRATQRLVFLGLGIDSQRRTLFIPAEKRVKVQEKLNTFLRLQAPRVKLWQSIAGSLNYLAQVVRAGRTYLSSVYGGLAGVLSQSKNKRRRVSEEVKEDLGVWCALLEAPPEKPYDIVLADSSSFPPLITDASTSVGFGGIWGDQWFYGSWPQVAVPNIAVLELFPIVIALLMLQECVANCSIRVFTDNMALVSVINKLYSKDPALRKMLRHIAKFCLNRNIHITAFHVKGVDNIGPDLLSRGKIEKFRLTFPAMRPDPIAIPHHLDPINSGFIT